MSDRQMWIALRYVEENPCRAGMVTSPELYRWSSAATHLAGKPDRSGILDLAFWLRAGGVETWAEMFEAPGRPADLASLRKCTYGGRPFGEEEFVREMEQRFDREWRRSVPDSVGILAKAGENGTEAVPN
jgi:putative transposase